MSALITRMYTSILDVFLIFTRLIIFFFFFFFFFFFNDTATTEIYTLSLHDALPIFALPAQFLRGSYPPLVTPFRGDRVDCDAYASLVDFQVREGSHGIVVNGTTAEPSLLSVAERKRLCEVAVQAAARRLPVVVATGSH